MARSAWLIVWGIFSVVGFTIVMMFFLLPEDLLHAISGAVSVPHNDCPLCGMTRAFCSISNGELEKAYALNKGSIPLFAVLFVSPLVLLSFAFLKRSRILKTVPSPTD